MARRSGLGTFVKTVVKISKEIDRANKASARAAQRAARAEVRELKQKEQERKKEEREAAQKFRREMREKAQAERSAKKYASEKEKENKKRAKEREFYLESISNELSPKTEIEFGLGKVVLRGKTKFDNWSIDSEIKILRKSIGKKEFTAKYGTVRYDELLFSGKFNSVLGLEGLFAFKKALESLKLSFDDRYSVQDVESFLDYLFIALVQTGTYLILPEEEAVTKEKWLTAYRYISIHENSISEIKSRSEVESGICNFEVPDMDRELFSKEDLTDLCKKLSHQARHLVYLINLYIEQKNNSRLVA